MRKTIIACAIVALGIGATSATAASLLTGADVKDNSLTGADVRGISYADLTSGLKNRINQNPTINAPKGDAGAAGKDGVAGAPGAKGADGKDGTPGGAPGEDGSVGPQGEPGADGASGLEGARYAVAFYDVGHTNAGAIATVACDADPAVSQQYIATSGGVQMLGIGDTQAEIDAANSRNTPVSSSFPGRMDWSTNTPKVNRLDGWIVQFGGNAGATSDKAPENAKVWALCVKKTADVPVVETYKESADVG